MTIKIKKSVIQKIELMRIDRVEEFIDKHDYMDINETHIDDVDWLYPAVFLLVGKKDVITNMIKMRGINDWLEDNGGCGQMPHISSTEIAKGIVEASKKNLEVYGIARIGTFHTENQEDRGRGLSDISQASNGKLFMLSAGRNGIIIEKYMDKQLTYKVV